MIKFCDYRIVFICLLLSISTDSVAEESDPTSDTFLSYFDFARVC